MLNLVSWVYQQGLLEILTMSLINSTNVGTPG